MSVKFQGFRFIRRGTAFRWCHVAEMLSTDVDCTNMTDDQFESAVREVTA